MPLTDTRLRALKPRESVYRIADRDGLCIEVRPSGGRFWRYRYRFAGRAQMLSLGRYPSVSLQDARRAAQDARALLDAGTDPAHVQRRAQARSQAPGADCFEPIAREWLSKQQRWSPATTAKAVALLETWAFPFLGRRPLASIDPPEMLAVLRRPESQGKIETAQRLKQRASAIFRYGVATGRCTRDPTADLRGILTTVKTRHLASLRERKSVGELMRAIDGYSGHLITRCALQLSAVTFVRPGELRHWEWSEISRDGSEWRIPGEKMKMGDPHIVPLADQARAVLDELRPLTGRGRYVFPAQRGGGRPMSENTVNVALRAMGYSGDQMTAHGFRSMASTLLNEAGWNRDWIERQLAHSERDAVRAAYNYAEYLPERRRMMQAWADMLDGLRAGGDVVPFKAQG